MEEWVIVQDLTAASQHTITEGAASNANMQVNND